MNLNEEINKMRVMMGLNEVLITEKLTDVEVDVDFIYGSFFKNDIDEIEKTGKVRKGMFRVHEIDSSMLISEPARQAHAIAPVTITINKKYGSVNNFYDFKRHLINVSVVMDAFEIALDFDGDIEKASERVSDDPEVRHRFTQEFTEVKIKGSIHHELAHWIHNTLNKNAVEREIGKYHAKVKKERKKVEPMGQAGEKYISDVNTTYIERQAQIHNIKQAHNKYKDIWDEITFGELLRMVPTIGSVYTRLKNNKDRDLWVKQTKQRMYREGLLGKKMYN